MAIKKTAPKSSKSTGSGKSSLADLWDGTDSSEASNNLPAGEHEVRLNSMELKKDPKKGTAVIVQYEAIEGEAEGKTGRQMYKLTDAGGNKAPGMAYLMRDLELLGYEKVGGAKLEKTLKEISEEQPMVIVTAKENGQYTNIYLQGTVENAGSAEGDANGDEAEPTAEIEVGSKVTFADPDDADETLTGEVTKINVKTEVATVEVEDHDDSPFKVDMDDLTLADEDADAEPEGEDAALEEGDEVTFDDEDGDNVEGEIISINEKLEIAKVKVGKKIVKVPLDDLTKKDDDDAEAEAYEPEESDEVTWTDADGDDHEGTIQKLNTKKGTAKIKDEDDDEFIVAISDLTKKD